MRVKVDRHGRVLLPKQMRVRYAMRPGTELEVSQGAQEFTLRPIGSSPNMVNDNGIWVHQGVPNRRLDFAKIIRESRERG